MPTERLRRFAGRHGLAARARVLRLHRVPVRVRLRHARHLWQVSRNNRANEDRPMKDRSEIARKESRDKPRYRRPGRWNPGAWSRAELVEMCSLLVRKE